MLLVPQTHEQVNATGQHRLDELLTDLLLCAGYVSKATGLTWNPMMAFTHHNMW
jgi:hypothetical protein